MVNVAKRAVGKRGESATGEEPPHGVEDGLGIRAGARNIDGIAVAQRKLLGV